MAPYTQQNPLEFVSDINQKAGTWLVQFLEDRAKTAFKNLTTPIPRPADKNKAMMVDAASSLMGVAGPMGKMDLVMAAGQELANNNILPQSAVLALPILGAVRGRTPKSKRVLLTEAQKRANRRANTANRRFREALPSDDDLLSEFRSQGIPEELIPVYKRNVRSGWARTRKAASQQSVETHAGHHRNLLSSGDPLKQKVNKLDTTATTGRTARLEPASENLSKGARYGSMNQHVSDITGMPSNWRKDIKQWHQHYQGEPSLHYDSDWTVEQMDMLEAIPENWSKSKVMGRIEEIKQYTPASAGQQYKSIQKELSEEALREYDLLETNYRTD